jgi:hypothetical protein
MADGVGLLVVFARSVRRSSSIAFQRRGDEALVRWLPSLARLTVRRRWLLQERSDEGVGLLVAFAPSRAFQPGCVLQERSDEGGRLALRSDGSSVVLWIILGCPQILIRR